MKKTIFIILIFNLLILFCLGSCSKNTDEEIAQSNFGESAENQLIIEETVQSGSEESAENQLTIYEKEKVEYALIHPEGVNESIINVLVDASYTIGNKTGIQPDVSSDYLNNGEEISNEATEILVGATNRPESEKAMKDLQEGTFAIKVIGNKIVIVADDDALLIDAINYFVKTYITPSKNTISVPNNLNYTSRYSEHIPVSENKDGTVTLKLNRFVIVYDSENKQKFIEPVANAFAKRVMTDHNTPGITEDESENKYEILFGSCDREEFKTTNKKFLFRDFFIGYSDNKISVSAFSIYGYENAINFLMQGFEQNGITIPKDGIYKQYDYTDNRLGEVLKNYENPTLDGAWMVNVSHRGDFVTNNNPENSILAYKSCIDNRIDVIETDLRMTHDGVWVICHDSKVDRTTDGVGKVSDLTYQEIKELNLKSSLGGPDSGITEHKIPILTDIIKLCKNKCLLNLDKLSTSDFQSVYDVFEQENAIETAMFKSGDWSAEDLTYWFADLISQGRKLPLYVPLLYKKTQSNAKNFVGLVSMTETGREHSKETLDQLLNEYNIRAMCLTALDSSSENFETYSSLKKIGYTAIMTDKTILLKEFIHGK